MEQMITGAAAPVDLDAHLWPASEYGPSFSGFWPKQPSSCSIRDIKTPTERTAGAACVVGTGNKLASHCDNSITVDQGAIAAAQKVARMRGVPRAEYQTLGSCAATSRKNLNTFSGQCTTKSCQVIHHEIESEPPPPIKTSAKKQPKAEARDHQRIRGASERRRLSRGGAGTIARNAWLIGRVYRVHPNLMGKRSMHSGIFSPPKISMGAAIPLDHDAHRSPANQVDENPKGGLRRKPESNCDILGTKIPGSIAARPGITSKRPPKEVCVAQAYQDSSLFAIVQREGPASESWAGPKDCGFRAAGAQGRFDNTTVGRIPLTIRYKVFQNLTVEFVPHG